MQEDPGALLPHEAQAARALAPSLQPVLNASDATSDLLREYGALADRQSTEHPAAPVQAHLLPRLADDLAATALLAKAGYAPQATGLAASAFEVAFTSARVAWNPAEANKWLQHTDLKHSVYGSTAAISVLRAWGFDENQAKGLWQWYRLACLPKHANPVIERDQETALTHVGHLLRADPQFGSRTAWQAYIALYIAITSASYAFGNFIHDCPLRGLTKAQWDRGIALIELVNHL